MARDTQWVRIDCEHFEKGLAATSHQRLFKQMEVKTGHVLTQVSLFENTLVTNPVMYNSPEYIPKRISRHEFSISQAFPHNFSFRNERKSRVF